MYDYGVSIVNLPFTKEDMSYFSPFCSKKVVDDENNGLEVNEIGNNEYVFQRLKKTNDDNDKDLTHSSGFYVIYKTSDMEKWIFPDEKVSFDSQDYTNDDSTEQSLLAFYFNSSW